jgi:hypothetical protein
MAGAAGVRGGGTGLVYPYGPEPLVHPCPGLLGVAGGRGGASVLSHLAHQSAALPVEPLTL